MIIKLKCTDRISTTFNLKIDSLSSVKDLRKQISLKLNKDPTTIILKRGTEILNDKLDLDSYEFGSNGFIEINYI
jgi:hypothetical protein